MVPKRQPVITDLPQNEKNRGNLQAFWVSQTKAVLRTILDSEMKMLRSSCLDKWIGATRWQLSVNGFSWPLKNFFKFIFNFLAMPPGIASRDSTLLPWTHGVLATGRLGKPLLAASKTAPL